MSKKMTKLSRQEKIANALSVSMAEHILWVESSSNKLLVKEAKGRTRVAVAKATGKRKDMDAVSKIQNDIADWKAMKELKNARRISIMKGKINYAEIAATANRHGDHLLEVVNTVSNALVDYDKPLFDEEGADLTDNEFTRYKQRKEAS